MTGIINSPSPRTENNSIAFRMEFLDPESHPELLLSMAPLDPPVHMLNVLTLKWKAGPDEVPERILACGVMIQCFLFFCHFILHFPFFPACFFSPFLIYYIQIMILTVIHLPFFIYQGTLHLLDHHPMLDRLLVK